MKILNKIAFFLIISISIYACLRADIRKSFVINLKWNDSVSIYGIDTLRDSGVIFYLPNTDNKLLNIILDRDVKNSLEQVEYNGGEIRYEIMQCSDIFVSVIKYVYIEDEGSPRGFFVWEECLNYFMYYNDIYKIKYNFNKEYDSEINKLLSTGEIDLDCEKMGLKEKANICFYFYEGVLYLHNPINSPFCQINFSIPFDIQKISFIKQ
jgi:hypothetical protein